MDESTQLEEKLMRRPIDLGSGRATVLLDDPVGPVPT